MAEGIESEKSAGMSLSHELGTVLLAPPYSPESDDDSGNDFEEDVLSFANAFRAFLPSELRPKVEGFVEDKVQSYSDEEFRRNFRLRRDVCETLVAGFAASDVYPMSLTHGGATPKTPECHVLSFLWYAGNKSSIRDVAGRFGVSESCLHSMLTRVMTYLCQIAHRVICFPEHLEGLAQEFEKISGFPGVIGCIDGTFIPIRCPAHKPRVTYVNRHDMISLTLQGICDNRRRFLDVSTGFPSKIHDGRVLTLSNISKRLPSLCDGGRYHILGDAAYPCREYLITPYKDYGNLTEAQSTFNMKLSATRVLIENTFGILKQRFRQLKDVEFFSVERMCQLIMSCCVVHNLCIDANDLMEESLQESQEDLAPGDGDVGEEQTALRTLGELKRQWLVNMVAQ